MAGEFLLGALGGLTVDPTDTYWALGSQALAQASPALFQRGDSGGRTFGTALGLGLLQSLLQFQAKRQANEDTIEASKLATPLFSMTNPAERAGYLTSLQEQGVGTNVLGKVSGLASALTQQEQMLKLMQAQRRAELNVELPANLLSAQVAAGGVSPKQLSEVIKELNKGTGAEAAFQKAVEPTPTPVTTTAPETTDIAALSTELGAKPESIVEKASQPLTIRDEALAKAGPPPIVESITQDDIDNLSPREIKLKQSRISDQQKAADDYRAKLTNIESSLQHKSSSIMSLGDTLNRDPVVQGYTKVNAQYEKMKELAKIGTRASIDQFITLSSKITDPESVVTLGEYKKNEDVQSAAEKITQQIKNLTSPNPRIAQSAVNEILTATGKIHNVITRDYEDKIRATMERGRALGLGEIDAKMLGISKPITPLQQKAPLTPQEAQQLLTAQGINWQRNK